MNPSFYDTAYFWLIITHMGSASLVLPVLAIAAVSLWRAGQLDAVRVWLVAMALAVALTLASKIMFLGWGIGIASLDFTGISGHTLLATSVLPVLLGWCLAKDQGSSSSASLGGVVAGLLVGVVVGISRVVLGAHSVSEVVFAWVIGLAVSALTLNAMTGRLRCPRFARSAPLILLLAFHNPSSTYLRTHELEVELALLLSGHEVPYARRHLIAKADAKVRELPD